MFRFSEEDKLQLVRKSPVKSSELELRFSQAGLPKGNLGFTYPLFKKILDYIWLKGSQKTTRVYRNDSYQDIGTSVIRLTYEQGRAPIAIKKTKIKTDYHKDLTALSFRLGEALENPIVITPALERELREKRRPSTRQITRYTVKIDEIVFELSQVGDDRSASYEIEVELPKDRIPEFAEKAISFLLEATLSGNDLPRNIKIPSMEDFDRDLQEIRRIAGVKGNVREYSLGFLVNPVNLKKDFLLKSGLDDYCLTDKLDGERRILANVGSGRIIVLNSGGYIPNKPASVYYLEAGKDLPLFIFDTEYYQGSFRVFDVASDGKNLVISRETRHEDRMKIVTKELEPYHIYPKRFYYSGLKDNILEFIRNNKAEEWFHRSDGLIFTQKQSSYAQTRHYKFKFPSKMSIDFFLGKGRVPNRYSLYVFQQGLVPFSYGSLPDTLESNVIDYNEKIVECVLYNGNWVVLRERPDKENPNSIRTATDVAGDIVDPLYLHDLIDEKEPGVEKYLDTIKHLEKYFLPNKLLEEGKLITQCYNSSPDKVVNEISDFFSIPNPEYKRDVYDRIRVLITQNASDPFIVNLLSIMVGGQFYYHSGVEYELVEKLILPTIGVKSFMDSRTERPWSLADMGTRFTSPNAGLVEIVLDRDPSMRRGKFSPAVIQKDSSYDNYIAMERSGDRISQYSSLMPWHKRGVTAALQKWFPKGVLKIADMSSHVGIDDLHFVDTFSMCTVDAYEIQPDVFDALQANVAEKKAIRPFLKDSCFSAYTEWKENQYEMVFIDAPWGGKDYDKVPKLKLYLQSENDLGKLEVRNVVNVAKYLLSKNITKTVVLKVPVNFDVDDLDRNFGHETIDISSDSKISYKLILLTPKVGPALTGENLLLWSTPYTDSYDRIFAGRQPHIFVNGASDILKSSVKKSLMEWNYANSGSSPRELIDDTLLMAKASEKGYHFIGIYEKSGVRYSYFSTVQESKMPGFAPVAPPRVSAPLVSAPIAPPLPSINAERQQRMQQQQAQQQPVQQQPVQQQPRFQQPQQVQQPPRFQQQQEDRDSLYYMRKYHNAEKRNIISLYCGNRSVLDLGAGKGGDLSKYSAAKVNRLVLVEPDEEKIVAEDGLVRRLEEMSIKGISTIITTKGEDTPKILKGLRDTRVEIVASFFSMTFLFESIDILRSFLGTVDSALLEGGYFIGTMMSGEKAKQLLLGKRDVTLGDVTINKFYDDALPPSTGQKLRIDISGSATVHDQYEYLAYFSILEEELKSLGFVLELLYDFNPEQYFDSKNMDKNTKDFSSLNISFVFRKMPTQLSLETDILKSDTTQEFFNLYGELSTLYRTGVEKDGSCFYHSYLSNADPRYLQASKQARAGGVAKLRKEFSEWVTVDRYLVALPFTLYNYIKNYILTKDMTKEYHEYVSPEYKENFVDEYKTLPQSFLDVLLPKLQQNFIAPLKKKISDPTAWAEEEDITLFMEYMGTNIYIFSTTDRSPIRLLLPSYKVSRSKSIMILSFPDRHFEPLFFGEYKTEKGKKTLYAKRILKRIEPRLIYIHQWLLKKVVGK